MGTGPQRVHDSPAHPFASSRSQPHGYHLGARRTHRKGSLMVDVHPGSAMPEKLQRYWLHGKGAAKIRWGLGDGDYYRCLRQLGKYIHRPDMLRGACATLHKKALGVWPGREHLSYEDIASHALLAASPPSDVRW